MFPFVQQAAHVRRRKSFTSKIHALRIARRDISNVESDVEAPQGANKLPKVETMKNPNTPGRLATLPPELLIKILQTLTAKELCQMRRLSKGLKTFVDENQGTLLTPLTHHVARIGQSREFLVKTSKLSLEEATSRLLHHQIDLHKCFDDSAAARFFANYLSSNEALRPSYMTGRSIADCLTLGLIWALATSISTEAAAQTQNTRAYDNVDQWIKLRANRSNDSRLQDGLAPISRAAEKYQSVERGKCLNPHFLLNRLNASLWETYDAEAESFVSHLGLEFLRYGTRFDYCVTTLGVQDLAREQCATGATDMTLLERAGLLEEIFIW